MNKPYYKWSYFYKENSKRSFSNRHTTQAFKKIVSIFLVFIGGISLFLKIHSSGGSSFQSCVVNFFQTPKGIILGVVYLLLILFTFTPLERFLLKRDDLSFLEKIPEDQSLSFRSVEVYFSEASSEILVQILYRMATAKEEMIEMKIPPLLIAAMGIDWPLQKVVDRIDEEMISITENKHLALLLELIFYGKKSDLERYLSFQKEGENQVEQIFSYFSTQYQF